MKARVNWMHTTDCRPTTCFEDQTMAPRTVRSWVGIRWPSYQGEPSIALRNRHVREAFSRRESLGKNIVSQTSVFPSSSR